MDTNTIKQVIAVIERRLERQNRLAHHYFNEGDDAQWEWHQARAWELEFTINAIKEAAQ